MSAHAERMERAELKSAVIEVAKDPPAEPAKDDEKKEGGKGKRFCRSSLVPGAIHSRAKAFLRPGTFAAGLECPLIHSQARQKLPHSVNFRTDG